MTVEDQHYETLRAFFTDQDEFVRRGTRLEEDGDVEGFRQVLVGALAVFTQRYFATRAQGDIVRWVAQARARLAREGGTELDFDAAAAEELLRAALGEESRFGEYDEEARADVQYAVLDQLRVDLELDEDELDDLLRTARAEADRAF